jgi:hypothetical protein
MSLTKAQSDAYKTLPKDQKTDFLNQSREVNQGFQNVSDFKKEISGEKKPGFFDRFKKKEEVKFTVPGKDATSQQRKVFESMVKAKIDNGIEPSPEEASAYFLKGKKVEDFTTQTERNDHIYQTYKALNDESLSEEVKDQILKDSGMNKQSMDYFKQTKLDEADRKSIILNNIDWSNKDRKSVMITLLLNKRKVGGNEVLTSGMIDYLYDSGELSEDEKKLSKAIKFDELTNKFYISRDYKSNSGYSSYVKKINSIYKDIYETAKVKRNKTDKINTTNTSMKLNKILATKKRQTGNKLWFTAY